MQLSPHPVMKTQTETKSFRDSLGFRILAVITLATMVARADLSDGLVSYWPLDDVVGTTTPDLVSGYDMELNNLTADDLIAGRVGRAMMFDSARQTLLSRVSSPGEQLPINQHPALTIAFWANVTGTGLIDLRLFSEGSTANNNPLFNLGTANNGDNGTLDFYFRQSGWAEVNHLRSVGEPLDGTWRHIAFVQEEDGSRALYIDGVLDPVEIPAKEPGDWLVNTTSIGGILRANPSHWLTGAMDEVMLWSRALTQAEIQQVVQEGLDSVFPPITRGMVAYWPLDEVFGSTTPDIANGYDMQLLNMTEADLIPGRFGQAFMFDSARQTMLARISSPGEPLPINQHPALTISMWANVTGTGLNDLRLFSEGSTANNNPLFNLGTANNGDNGTLDFFFRQTGWATVDHLRSVGEPLDGTWRHIVFVQQEDGSRALYIDGVQDPVEIPAKEPGDWLVNTTSIGGILRANPSHWLTGAIDDVALWNRALSQAEITSLYQDGTTIPFTKPQPLMVRSFRADLPAVAVGDSVWLRWDVTKNVRVEIDRGIGDVTAQTVAGLGAIEVTLPSTRTFTLTLTRGEETFSETLTVYAIDGVAEGWTLLDNFDRYELGLLAGQGPWFDLDGADFSIVSELDNQWLAPHAGNATAVLPLGPLTVFEGQQRTLFFRFLLTGDWALPIRGQVALTDRRLRFGNEIGSNMGPGAAITDELSPSFRYVSGWVGWPAMLDIGGFENPETVTNLVWNVWVDIDNGPFQYANGTAINTGDLYSLHVAQDGEAGRATVFSNQIASRDPVGQIDLGFTTQHLDRLVAGAYAGHTASTNLFVTDIYLSKDGFNSTVPRAFGYTIPVVEAEPPSLDIQLIGGQIGITWTHGVLESSTSITGPWTAVQGATSPHQPTVETGQRFYRARD
jgi:hypothetical protein